MLNLLRSRRGLAGLEFAVVAPFLVVVLLSLADLSRAIIVGRRLTVAAQETATIASTEAVQVSSLNILSAKQAYAATTAPFAIFPDWLPAQASTNNTFAITLSEVNFVASPKNCTATCTYAATVAWSVANPSGQPLLRPCGKLGSVANSTAATLATLPAGAFGATSLFVADVSQVFQPLFTSVFLGTFTMQRTAYVSPRVNNAVTLLPGFAGASVICPAAG